MDIYRNLIQCFYYLFKCSFCLLLFPWLKLKYPFQNLSLSNGRELTLDEILMRWSSPIENFVFPSTHLSSTPLSECEALIVLNTPCSFHFSSSQKKFYREIITIATFSVQVRRRNYILQFRSEMAFNKWRRWKCY